MSIRISADSLRQKAIEAMKLLDADGFAIGGNEGSIAITLTFDRKEAECTKSCSDSPSLTCSGGCVKLTADDSASCDGVANEARRETELTPRRNWTRWANKSTMQDMDMTAEMLVSLDPKPHCNAPVTVIEGHIDIAEIEREAYRRGAQDEWARSYATPQPIDGVEPVVVAQAWKAKDSVFWCGPQPNAWIQEDGVSNTPCTVAIWTGVVNGKKVQP